MDKDKLVKRFRLRCVYNGMLVRGWQVLRDEQPISFLFDEHEDALAAMGEFRTEEAAALRSHAPK